MASTEAHAQAKADEAALSRGRARLEDARAELARLNAVADAAIARHAERLTRHAIEGGKTAPPMLLPSDAEVAVHTIATRTLAATEQAVAVLEDRAKLSLIALNEAAAAEQAARDDARRAEVDRIAAQINTLRAQEYSLCARLATVDLDSAGAMLTPLALDVLQNPRARPSTQHFFGRGIAADIHSSISGDMEALAAAREFWADFDASLNTAPAVTEVAA